MNSHDVRRMRPCAECGELGMVDVETRDDLPALVRIGSGKAQRVAHPRCVDISLLMVLSRAELERLRMCDHDADVIVSIASNLKYRVEYGTDAGARRS